MNALLNAIKTVQADPKAFQSDWARANAYILGEAVSRGYITCLQGGRNIGKWIATAAGAVLLESQEA